MPSWIARAPVSWGLRCWFWEGLFFFLLGLVVSGASKSGGALLVFCLLVVVPATALLLARRLWAVLALSVLLGIVTTWAGLLTAYCVDLPANPTIIGLSCLLLMGVALVRVAVKASMPVKQASAPLAIREQTKE